MCFMLGGWPWRADGGKRTGAGAVMAQSCYSRRLLFLFDLYHALLLPEGSELKAGAAISRGWASTLQAAARQKRCWYGFPGTPAEMRPLAESPVAGRCIGLPTTRPRPTSKPYLTTAMPIGWLPFNCCFNRFPPGFVVRLLRRGLAHLSRSDNGLRRWCCWPFWQLGTGWQLAGLYSSRSCGRALQKAVCRRKPRVRHGLGNLLPGVDLDDPEVQQTLRR